MAMNGQKASKAYSSLTGGVRFSFEYIASSRQVNADLEAVHVAILRDINDFQLMPICVVIPSFQALEELQQDSLD